MQYYSVSAVLFSVCCIQCLLHSVSAASSVCCIQCLLHSVSAAFSVCIECLLHWTLSLAPKRIASKSLSQSVHGNASHMFGRFDFDTDACFTFLTSMCVDHFYIQWWMCWSDISHTVNCVTNFTTCYSARAGLRMWHSSQVAADCAGSDLFKLGRNKKYQNLYFIGYSGDNSQSPHC